MLKKSSPDLRRWKKGRKERKILPDSKTTRKPVRSNSSSCGKMEGGLRHLGLPVAGWAFARSQPLPVNTGTHNSIYKYLNTERLFAELTLWNLLESLGAAQPKKGHKLWLEWWTGTESSDCRTCNQLNFGFAGPCSESNLNLREKSSN